MFLSKWLEERKQKKEKELYNRGFDYAIVAIAKGEKAPLELDAEQVAGHRDQFDIGMDEAIDYAVQHRLVKDNRI